MGVTVDAGAAAPGGPDRALRRWWLPSGLSLAVNDRSAAVIALLGFLSRGGVVLLMLPIVVLPTPTNVVSMTGIDAISIAGQPTPWLITTGLIAAVAAVAWIAIACLLGSLVDYWLVELATQGSEIADGSDRPGTAGAVAEDRTLDLPSTRLLLKMAAIRFLTLVPMGIAIAWATTRLFVAGYDQLITPVDLATPLPIRIVAEAVDAVVVLVVVFLAVETVGAIAIRIQIRARAGIWRSLGRSLVLVVRHPLATMWTVATTYAGSVLAIGSAMFLCSVAFDWCRVAARNQEPISIWVGIGTRDFRPLVFVLTACILAAAWLLAMVVSGVTSAWRSFSFTNLVWPNVEPPRNRPVEPPPDGRTGQLPPIPG